jgi:hypothetical protein
MAKPSWTINIHLIKKKNEGQEKKINLFQRWVSVEGGVSTERENKGEYGGCIL